jgi:hypothetical protein
MSKAEVLHIGSIMMFNIKALTRLAFTQLDTFNMGTVRTPEGLK